MKELMKELLNSKSGGYVVFPRPLLAHFLSQPGINDVSNLYVHMLIRANYVSKPGGGCVMVQRGNLDVSCAELAHTLGMGRDKFYRLLRELKEMGLVVRQKVNGHVIWQLPMYEEHCGRMVRVEERGAAQPVLPADEKSESGFDEFFGYYHAVMHIPERDKAQARAQWRKLTSVEREAACENLERYSQAVRGQKHVKTAFHYLKEKSYEF